MKKVIAAGRAGRDAKGETREDIGRSAAAVEYSVEKFYIKCFATVRKRGNT